MSIAGDHSKNAIQLSGQQSCERDYHMKNDLELYLT